MQLTLRELADRFGLDAKGVQSYLDNADQHDYTLLKAPLTKKGQILSEWWRVATKIDDPSTAPQELPDLRRKRDDLLAGMEQLEDHVLGDPERASLSRSTG